MENFWSWNAATQYYRVFFFHVRALQEVCRHQILPLAADFMHPEFRDSGTFREKKIFPYSLEVKICGPSWLGRENPRVLLKQSKYRKKKDVTKAMISNFMLRFLEGGVIFWNIKQ